MTWQPITLICCLVWSNLCICCPGVVELVRSNLGTSFPLFHALDTWSTAWSLSPRYLKFISFQYCQESAKRQRISANLNIILYIGLGTMAIGLIITFVGIGEKGFKTIQLRKHFKHTQTQINQLLNIRRDGSHLHAFHGHKRSKEAVVVKSFKILALTLIFQIFKGDITKTVSKH